jgi:hypothetical protein
MNRGYFVAGSIALAEQHRLLHGVEALPLAAGAGAPRNLLSTTYTAEMLASRLLAAKDWHPYPKCGERASWEAIPADIRAAVIARAEQDRKTGWKLELATTFLNFKRNGDQTHDQNENWGRRAQMQRLALAECMEGKGRFVDDVANGIWLICEETSWSDSAHMYMQKAGVGLADVNEPVVDLFAAETAATLAWTRYLLGAELDRVSPEVGKRIALECERRILGPARMRDNFTWMGLDPALAGRKLNNWTPWINSNLIWTNLLLEEDAERRLHEMTRITRSVDAYLNQYWPDAGEEEGPTYYTRSPLSLFECVSTLESATGNSTQILTHPFLAAMGRYVLNAHVAGNCYINYGDADMHLGQEGELIYRYGKAVKDEQLAGFGAYCAERAGWTAIGEGLNRPMNSVLISMARALPALMAANEIRAAKKDEGLARDAWYPSLGLMTAREQEGSTKGMYVAVLAANNGRSHSHNDTGSPIVFMDGEPVLIDPGVETYNAKTFSADRYKIWTMQSAWHNLPTIGGVMQRNGADFKATGHRYASDDKKAVVSFDIATAYPKDAGVKSWVRTVTLDRVQHKVTIEEAFELERAVPVSLTAMTQRKGNVDPAGKVTLEPLAEGGKACVLQFDGKQLSAAIETKEITDERVRNDMGAELYRVLLNLKEPAAKGRIAYSFGAAIDQARKY